jgi:coenzyme PQQ precursor peptide PqqA
MISKVNEKKRSWTKPVVRDEQVGMEVTSYANATLRKK